MSEESPYPHTLLLIYLFVWFELLHTFLFGLGDLQVSIVGMIGGKPEQNTDVSFILDDGTGRIYFIRW